MKSLDKNQQDNIKWLSNSISNLTDSIAIINLCSLDEWTKELTNNAKSRIIDAISELNTALKNCADKLEINLPFNEED